MSSIDPREQIYIKGARANNLKDIDLNIPKNELIVVTGLSGSGKSSLVMETLYAEGQRRYVESLSSYARQFLNRMKKPDVDYIRGICPAIAIEQKVSTRNARSTVGTLTEIYDHLRLLFARAGKTISPVSGKEVQRHRVTDVVDYLMEESEGTRVILTITLPDKYYERSLEQELSLLLKKGYTRLYHFGQRYRLEEFIEDPPIDIEQTIEEIDPDDFRILIDRFAIHPEDEENTKRIADSVQTAFSEGFGECILEFPDEDREKRFNNRFELDGIEFLDPTPQLFNFNNPYGACPRCEGYGKVLGIDHDKVIPDPSKSIYDGAIACWSGEKSGKWLKRFIDYATKRDFPIHKPYEELTEEQKDLLWEGNDQVKGIQDYFDYLKQKMYKIQNRVITARYRGRTICPVCKGGRLREKARYIKIAGRDITELNALPVNRLYDFIDTIELEGNAQEIARRILIEIRNRLDVMIRIGLGYLTLDRLSKTLSGGETQRINLTRTLGSNLTRSLYILDEPSIGLHPRDIDQLTKVLKFLRDLGNTVIVVEHEEEIMRQSDFIVDMGPGAGIHGGEVVYSGSRDDFIQTGDTLTARYLRGEEEVPLPDRRRQPRDFINMINARKHNIDGIDVKIPLDVVSVISGVSGSGKSTLVKHILHPVLEQYLDDGPPTLPGVLNRLEGDIDRITQVEYITQNPIGRSSRSNPVTYIKAYDDIRKLMADQQLSKIRGFKAKHFSFNVEGGRCEECKGDGEITVEMQFLADVKLTCEECGGRRFKQEVLDVKYKGKSIYDILNLSIEEALTFFEEQPKIQEKLQPLYDVGLGYVKLGQSSSTLSGGEAQRVKLASFLVKERPNEHILFIFDEPTTGLHFEDVERLMEALNALVENGHTVVIIEHNLEVIKLADWIIDLGPGGGEEGGRLLFQGTPEDLVEAKESHTAHYLGDKLRSTVTAT